MQYTTAVGVLLVTAALFGALLVVGRMPNVDLPRVSRVIFAAAVVVCVVAAAILAGMENAWFPSLLLLLPFAPAAVLVAMLRDALRFRHSQSDAGAAMATPQAGHRSAPSATAETPHDELSTGAAGNGGGSAQDFTHEGNVPEAAARARAHNPHSAADELARLAYGHPSLRVAVAENPATPAAVLEWLAASGDARIAAAIASRGSMSPLRPVAPMTGTGSQHAQVPR